MNYVTCRSDVVSPIFCLCFLFSNGVHFKIKIVTSIPYCSISRAAIVHFLIISWKQTVANNSKLWA